jgi:WD40 repeat protein/tRNA A-37 threonylcarbamoyl transferase component Bud32
MRDDPRTQTGSRASTHAHGPDRPELGSTSDLQSETAPLASDRLICPSCHHTLDTSNLDQSYGVHCEKCGGSFRLERLAGSATIDEIRLIGRFQLLDRVGQGSFGTVWRARDTQLDRIVAVKIPHRHALESGVDAERLGREARVAAQLRHPGIVRLYEMLLVDDLPLLVSDFIEGIPLKQLLKIRRLTFHESALVTAQIAEALDHAHQRGLVHRDIKPANIMMEYGSADPNEARAERESSTKLGKPVVVDFGLALRPEVDIVMTADGQVLGTPAYMSPEQAAGDSRRVDGRSDIYSLGVVLYELLCGELPFRGSKMMVLHQLQNEDPRPPRRVNDHIPRDLETICLKAMAKLPSRRYASAGELALDLRRFLRGEPCRARPVGQLERSWLWARRNRSLAAALAATCLSLVAVAVFALMFAARERKHASELGARLAENYLDRGVALCEGGETAQGSLLLAKGLATVPGDSSALYRVLSANLAAWHEKLDPLVAQQDAGRSITAVAYSRDGKLVATGGEDHKVRRCDASSLRLIGEPTECTDSIRSLVFSPDSRLLAIVSRDNKLLLWDLRAGRSCAAPFEHPEKVRSIAFNRDGTLVAIEGADHALRLWDTALKRSRPQVLKHQQPIKLVAFAPGDKTIVTITYEGNIQQWDATSGARRGEPADHPNFRAADWSPDGRWLATGAGDGSVRIWDAASLKVVHVLRHPSSVDAVAFSPDGQTLLTGSADKIGRLWNVQNGERFGLTAFHRQALTVAAFSPDGTHIVTGDADGVLQLRRLRSTNPRCLELAHRAYVGVVRVSPDGRTAVSATKPLDGTEAEVQFWDPTTGEAKRRWTSPGIVTSVAFSPDGRIIATGSSDQTALVIDVASGKKLCPALRHDGWVHAVAFNPAGTRLLTACEDGYARIWEVPTGRCLEPALRHEQAVVAVAFSPDGTLALTGSADGTAKLWEVATGRQRHVFAHSDYVRCVAFSPDGKIALSASNDHTARLWDVRSGSPVGRPLVHQDQLLCAVFSPGGDTVLTGSRDKTAQLWSVATTSQLGPALVHLGPVFAVAYSPDRATVATASGDATARLWDIATSRPLGPSLRHRRLVSSLAFTPDGNRLLTGSVDATARVWDVPQASGARAQRWSAWIQTTCGVELAGNEALTALTPEQWQERLRQLDDMGGPPTEAR